MGSYNPPASRAVILTSPAGNMGSYLTRVNQIAQNYHSSMITIYIVKPFYLYGIVCILLEFTSQGLLMTGLTISELLIVIVLHSKAIYW